MLDAFARPLIDPPLAVVGTRLARAGLGADHVTAMGLALGLVAALMIWLGAPTLALVPLLASRLADGLDGAVARATRKTDLGGFYDIAADFLFYGTIPLAFVLADPAANGLAGAVLLASFYINGTTLLGYAILAERHRMETTARGVKSLYFSYGLLEGTETIAFFILICLFPDAFAFLSWIFAALCYLTAALRVLAARHVFSAERTDP